MDFTRWCRICSVDVKCGVFLFGEEARKSFLPSKIRKYLSVTITLHDHLSKMICEDCIHKLDGFHRFATMALKNQEKMTKFILENGGHRDISLSQATENHVSLLQSYLTNGLSIKKEQLEPDYEVTEVEVRIDPMAILQCCLEDEDSQSDENENIRNEECTTKEGLEEDVEDDIFKENYCNTACIKNKETNTAYTEKNQEKLPKEKAVDYHTIDQSGENNITNGKDIYKSESIYEIKVDNKTSCANIHTFDSDSTADNNSSDEDSENTRIIYLCSICNKNFDSEILLQYHVQLHKSIYAKELINFTKESIMRYKPNISPFLSLPIILPRLCGSDNINEQPVAARLVNPSENQCPICAKVITSAENLKIHLESHRPKGQYACDICGRVFKTESNLDKHKEYHGGIQYKCDVCGRVYPTNSTLRAHSITHSDLRPHKCPLCDKTFKRNQDLKFHINQHTGARPYQCPYCPKAFASSGNCFSHRKRMHPIEVERDKERAAKIMR